MKMEIHTIHMHRPTDDNVAGEPIGKVAYYELLNSYGAKWTESENFMLDIQVDMNRVSSFEEFKKCVFVEKSEMFGYVLKARCLCCGALL